MSVIHDHERTRKWLRRSTILTGCIAVAGVLVEARVESNNRAETEIKTAFSTDGFTNLVSVDTYADGSVHIGSVMVGRCEFLNVTADERTQNGSVSDAYDYRVPVSRIGDGKFEADALILHVQNVEELQAALPGVNCSTNNS